MKANGNPFAGRPGFWNRINQTLYPIFGPAQIGIGFERQEAPYVAPADPACPICGKSMHEHSIQRGNATTRTYLTCPK